MTAPSVTGDAWALFLDFDGTLVDIVERPDAVVADPALPPLLEALRAVLGGALAVVSGRPVAFLDEKLTPFRGDAAGLHGIERRVAGVLHPCRPEEHPALRRGVGTLQSLFEREEGVIIEDKGCSVAVHWRLVPEREEEVVEAVVALGRDLGEGYRIQYGKAVAELLPAASGKGPVIERFLQDVPYRGRRPLFVGDDLTDENGFAVVNRLGGLAIRIGDGETIARYRLSSPAALRQELERWVRDGGIVFDGLPEV